MKALGNFLLHLLAFNKTCYTLITDILEPSCEVVSNSTIYILWFCSEMQERLKSLSEDEHNKQ